MHKKVLILKSKIGANLEIFTDILLVRFKKQVCKFFNLQTSRSQLKRFTDPPALHAPLMRFTGTIEKISKALANIF